MEDNNSSLIRKFHKSRFSYPSNATLQYVKMIPLDVNMVPPVVICNTDVTTGILSGTYIKLLKFRVTQFLDFELLIFKKPPNTKNRVTKNIFFFKLAEFQNLRRRFSKNWNFWFFWTKNVLKYERKIFVTYKL